MVHRLLWNISRTLKFHHVLALLFGTRGREIEWAARPPSSAEGYWSNREHPSKKFLVERIAVFSPISSILEVGCNSGPSLYLLAKRFPLAEIMGIDINTAAVEYGNAQFASEGISNVKLLAGKADELGQFPDKSFDIIFTNSLLMYIGPDKIKQVVKEMIRLSRRALILVEWHCFESQQKDPCGMGIYRHGTWMRDYVALLKQFVQEENIRVTKIPDEVWPDKGWQRFGAVIEVVR